jgi:hypothetical protein
VSRQHSPDAPLAAEGKRKMERDQRLPEDREERGLPRPFYCRTCNYKVEGTTVPVGWLTLTRAAGRWESPHRLGLYCSVRCLWEQMPRLDGIEQKLGDRWLERTAEFRQVNTR